MDFIFKTMDLYYDLIQPIRKLKNCQPIKQNPETITNTRERELECIGAKSESGIGHSISVI